MTLRASLGSVGGGHPGVHGGHLRFGIRLGFDLSRIPFSASGRLNEILKFLNKLRLVLLIAAFKENVLDMAMDDVLDEKKPRGSFKREERMGVHWSLLVRSKMLVIA